MANDEFRIADYEQSAEWYQKSAEQGHAYAQYNLGHYYLSGTGVQKDEAKAIQWWLKSARQNNELAQFNVGRAYYLGTGTTKDATQARYWL